MSIQSMLDSVQERLSPTAKNPLLKHLDEAGEAFTTPTANQVGRFHKRNGDDGADIAREVRQAYNNGWDMDVRDRQGHTPLMLYARTNQVEALREAIRLGADVNARDKEGRTALMIANHYASAEVLLQAGADPNLKDNYEDTVVHQSQSKYPGYGDYQAMLVSYGADINARDMDGNTIMHVACMLREKAGSSYSKMTDKHIQDMVRNGVDPSIKNLDGVRAGEMYKVQKGNDPQTLSLVDAVMSRGKLQESVPTAKITRDKGPRL